CQLSLVKPASSPARFGAADDKDGNAGNGLQVGLEASTVNCGGRSATLFVNGAQTGTATASTGGQILFGNVQFADGASNVPVAIRMTDATNK
ncbi:MAG: hypothetical protein ACK4N5_27800, partial [Myxococcales bacterium]